MKPYLPLGLQISFCFCGIAWYCISDGIGSVKSTVGVHCTYDGIFINYAKKMKQKPQLCYEHWATEIENCNTEKHTRQVKFPSMMECSRCKIYRCVGSWHSSFLVAERFRRWHFIFSRWLFTHLFIFIDVCLCVYEVYLCIRVSVAHTHTQLVMVVYI